MINAPIRIPTTHIFFKNTLLFRSHVRNQNVTINQTRLSMWTENFKSYKFNSFTSCWFVLKVCSQWTFFLTKRLL